MIEILGVSEGREYEAATHLRKLMLAVWPDLSQSQHDHVKIFVGMKLYGYSTEDIDLVVIGHFHTPRTFDVEFKFKSRDGEDFTPRQASLKNFVLVIEAKSHDPIGVKFNGPVASVRYWRDGKYIWEPVTEKNRTQMFNFKKYMGEIGLDSIYIQDLIFFSGLRESDLPKRPHNMFASDASFERLLNVLGQISKPSRRERDAFINFGADDIFKKLVSPDFTLMKTLEPTPIDRGRMDRIVKSAIVDTWREDLGRKQVIIRGRGGVGKTVILLQLAYQTFDRDQKRSILLTYNRALVSDMRRTMALLGVPRNIENGGIQIDTVHAFIRQLMVSLNLIEKSDCFLPVYEDRKKEFLQYIRDGAISEKDIENLKVDYPDGFMWDAVFVDEGQDWPSNEIEILRALYGSERVVVADGVDQFVRESVADWSRGLTKEKLQVRRLRRCLRMKANLAHFVSDFAQAVSLTDWDIEPNPDANGGRVIILEGDLSRHPEIYQQFRDEAARLGNYPIDLLACVPPGLVMEVSAKKFSIPGQNLIEAGENVWDATSSDVRQVYSTNRDALRIVQYDSCRGLEGWTVFNYAFDDFWDFKYRQYLEDPEEIGELFDTPEERAVVHASRWSMIPLTRAMDTLVINIGSHQSYIRDALQTVQSKRSDFIEWIVL